MRSFFFLLAALILSASPAAAETRFFSSLEDVPLAPGLVEIPDQTIAFDKPEGRIVEQVARVGLVSEPSVKAYYESALPQLGWRRTGPLAFARDKESLRLSFESADGARFLRIGVAPARVSGD